MDAPRKIRRFDFPLETSHFDMEWYWKLVLALLLVWSGARLAVTLLVGGGFENMFPEFVLQRVSQQEWWKKMVDGFIFAWAGLMLIRPWLARLFSGRALDAGLVLEMNRTGLTFRDAEGGEPHAQWNPVLGTDYNFSATLPYDAVDRVEREELRGGGDKLIIEFDKQRMQPPPDEPGSHTSRLELKPPWEIEEIAQELVSRLEDSPEEPA